MPVAVVALPIPQLPFDPNQQFGGQPGKRPVHMMQALPPVMSAVKGLSKAGHPFRDADNRTAKFWKAKCWMKAF